MASGVAMSLATIAPLTINHTVKANDQQPVQTLDPTLVRSVVAETQAPPQNSNNTSDPSTNSSSSNSGGGSSKAKKGTVGTPGGQFDLSAAPTYKDLYASVIFSRAADEAIDEMKITYKKLSTLPDSGAKNKLYGQLVEHDFGINSTQVGTLTARYLKTLHAYKYINVYDRQNNFVEGLWDNGVNAGSAVIDAYLLRGAYLGGSVYLIGDKLLTFFQNFMRGFDIPTVLGYTMNGRQDQSNNILAKFVKEFFDDMGLNRAFIDIMRILIWVFLAAGALFSILFKLGRMQLNGIGQVIGRLLLRVFVIASSLTVTNVLSNVVDTLSNGITANGDIARHTNEMYILDTLKWAVATNLDLSSIGGTISASNSDNPNSPLAGFEPTSDAIRNLNKAANTALTSGLGANASPELKAAEAIGMLNKVATNAKVTVDDYHAGITKAQGSAIAASASPSQGATISAGSAFGDDYAGTFPNHVYFFSSAGREEEEVTKEQIKQMNAATLKANGLDSSMDDEDYKDFQILSLAGKSIAINKSSGLKARSVSWSKPETYIYGAEANNSEETGNVNNFFNGKGTKQNNNPITGEDKFEDIKGEGDAKISKDELKTATYTNSLAVSLMNRYGGTLSGQGLSTQSTSFVLQTSSTGESLLFEGYNTPNSNTDKGKAAGSLDESRGATFSQYTIPNKNVADYMSKVGKLSVLWITCGFATLVAFFTLFKAPIISATIKMITAFLRAITVGDPTSLMEYIAYYAAVQFSFGFARWGIILGANLANFLQNLVDDLAGPNSPLTTFSNMGGAAATLLDIGIPFSQIIMGGLFCYLLCWPIVELKLGKTGRRRKTGLIGFVVMLPYMMAESLDEYLDQFHQKLYGRSKRQSFGAKIGNQVDMVDQGTEIKERGIRAAKLGALAASAVATGGGAMLAKGALATGASALNVARGVAGEAMSEHDAMNLGKGGTLNSVIRGAKGVAAGGTAFAQDFTVNAAKSTVAAAKNSALVHNGKTIMEATGNSINDVKDAIKNEDRRQAILEGRAAGGALKDDMATSINNSRMRNDLAKADMTEALKDRAENAVSTATPVIHATLDDAKQNNSVVKETKSDVSTQVEKTQNSETVNEKVQNQETGTVKAQEIEAKKVSTTDQVVQKAQTTDQVVQKAQTANETVKHETTDDKKSSGRDLGVDQVNATREQTAAINKQTETLKGEFKRGMSINDLPRAVETKPAPNSNPARQEVEAKIPSNILNQITQSNKYKQFDSAIGERSKLHSQAAAQADRAFKNNDRAAYEKFSSMANDIKSDIQRLEKAQTQYVKGAAEAAKLKNSDLAAAMRGVAEHAQKSTLGQAATIALGKDDPKRAERYAQENDQLTRNRQHDEIRDALDNIASGLDKHRIR